MAGKSVMVVMSQPRSWVELFEKHAVDSGKSLSEWIGDACIEMAAFESNVSRSSLERRLGTRSKPGRPKIKIEGNKND